MVRPPRSFLDQSQRWAGLRQVWRQPRFRRRALEAVATRCWRKRMSARASAKERGWVVVTGVFMLRNVFVCEAPWLETVEEFC